MTKQVQLVGYPYEVMVTFVGLDRELTVDEDNRSLVLHDGVTPGGVRFLNRDQMDERYQARSEELTGLLGWEPNQRGLVTRFGPQDYRLREFEVDTRQLTIVNPDGHDGNPAIGFADTITSEHRWEGQQQFAETVEFQNGILGNLDGDSYGTHHGPVTGNTTGTHNGPSNGTHTGAQVGDVDVRGHTMQMDDGQIDLAWLSPEIFQYIVNAGLPIGSVIAFAGTTDAIPTNWYICDGTNGTPDLRGRFILGSNATYLPDATGGSATHTHAFTTGSAGAHVHTGTTDGHVLDVTEMPNHRHLNGIVDDTAVFVRFPHGYVANPSVTTGYSIKDGGSILPAVEGYTDYAGNGDPHTHDITVNSAGAHTHTGTTESGSTLPPFYSLIYIMKGA